jgi:hypothetical protein
MVSFRSHVLILAAAGAAILTIAGAAGDEPQAKVKQAVAVRVGPDRNGLSVEYEYKFVGQDRVHIGGLGDVPAEGSFKYITEASELVFSDVSDKKVLARLTLKETVAVAAKPRLNKVPANEEFDPAIRSFRWTSQKSFQFHAGAVLGKYVSYSPREVGGVTEFATTFAPITATIDGQKVPGRVAMLLSFPYDKDRAGFAVRVRMLAQEGRLKSDDFKNTGDQAILKEANSFVEKIMNELSSSR